MLEVVVALLGMMMVMVFPLVTFFSVVLLVTMVLDAPVSAIPIGISCVVFGVMVQFVCDLNVGWRGQLKFLDF